MSASTLRLITIILTAVGAALAFFLGGAQSVGVSPMVSLILGAVLAAINITVGYLPSFAGASGLEPGKSEKDVARQAMVAGQRGMPTPEAIV